MVHSAIRRLEARAAGIGGASFWLILRPSIRVRLLSSVPYADVGMAAHKTSPQVRVSQENGGTRVRGGCPFVLLMTY